MKYTVYVENMNKQNPTPKYVWHFDTNDEAEDFIKERKEQFVYEYDDERDIAYRSKFNFFVKEEN